MPECDHDYQHEPNAVKERCTKCGAARKYDPNRCNHDWQQKPGSVKERCLKCGAARMSLDVQDVKIKQITPEVK